MMNEITPILDNSLTCFLNYNFKQNRKVTNQYLAVEDNQLKTIDLDIANFQSKFSLALKGSLNLKKIVKFIEEHQEQWIKSLQEESLDDLDLQKQCGLLSLKVCKKPSLTYHNPFEWKFTVRIIYPTNDSEKNHLYEDFPITYHRATPLKQIAESITKACETPIFYTTQIQMIQTAHPLKMKFHRWENIGKFHQMQTIKIHMSPLELFKEIYVGGDELDPFEKNNENTPFLKDSDKGKDLMLKITFSQRDEKALIKHLFRSGHQIGYQLGYGKGFQDGFNKGYSQGEEPKMI